ncbi:MAG: hypothetical protein SV239_12910, partial [Thermodesulfobacteriota bacterium]|nr:hypothetical protein [Thermodesulfobacteriota bacterium]
LSTVPVGRTDVRPGAVIHLGPGPGHGIIRSRAGGIPIHRGAVIHQGDACVAPTFDAFPPVPVGAHRCAPCHRHPSRSRN